MVNRNKWVVVQGPDGVGKSTVIDMIYKDLKRHGKNIPTCKLKSAGSGIIGSKLRKMYIDDKITDILKPTVSAIMHMDHFNTVKISMDNGYNTISDRYIGCFYTYNYKLMNQVGSLDIFNTLLNNDEVMNIRPDLIIHIDADLDTILERTSTRCNNPLDTKCMDNLVTIRNGYTEFYENYDGRVSYIDNNGTIEYLKKSITEAVSQLF